MNKLKTATNSQQSFDSQNRNRKSKYLEDNKRIQGTNKTNYQQDQSIIERLQRQRNFFVQKQNYPQNMNKNFITSQNKFQKSSCQQSLNTQQSQKPRRYAYIKAGQQSSKFNEQSSSRQKSLQQFKRTDISSQQKKYNHDYSYRDRSGHDFQNLRNYNRTQSECSISKINSFSMTKRTQNQQPSSSSEIYRNRSHQRQYSETDRIQQLQRQLEEQKLKFKIFQKQTIENQVKVLETINSMQIKLKTVHQQNLLLKQKNSQLMKYQQQNSQVHELQSQLKQKQIQFQQLTKQHIKIKDIGRRIVQMMKKVDLIEVPQHQDQIKFAWRWLKKVVWEYEGIRKKAMQWKVAYQELHQDSVDSQDH